MSWLNSGIEICLDRTGITIVPKIKLSHDFHAVSPEFKESFNAWLESFFGTKEVAIQMGNRVFVSSSTYAKLRSL